MIDMIYGYIHEKEKKKERKKVCGSYSILLLEQYLDNNTYWPANEMLSTNVMTPK